MASPSLISFQSRGEMALRVADLVQAKLSSTAFLDGYCEIAVSGGSTPKGFYCELASRDLPWAKIKMTLIDERWVPMGRPRSNEVMLRNAFRSSDGLKIIGLYTGASSPRLALLEISDQLDQRRKPFDVVVLGMGEDGHTASWFPHAQGLRDALKSESRVAFVSARRSDVTGEETERVTLTLSAVRDAALIVLLIAGPEKKATYEKALEPGNVEDMPVRAVLRMRPDMCVCWSP